MIELSEDTWPSTSNFMNSSSYIISSTFSDATVYVNMIILDSSQFPLERGIYLHKQDFRQYSIILLE